MATFKRFEEMHAWQSARELVKVVYALTKQAEVGRDFALRDQIRRAAISVMSNKANTTERQINSLIGYLTRSRGKTIKDDAVPYVLNFPDDL